MRFGIAICMSLPLVAPTAFAQTDISELAVNTVDDCARIDSAIDRLACYDRFSGRAAKTTPPAAGTKSVPQTPSAATPPVAPAETFGSYAAEHPVIRSALESLTANVVDFSVDRTGHQTVALDNGQWWRLYGADELLSKGNSITIKRAALGSFILKTPSGRTYRATRLK